MTESAAAPLVMAVLCRSVLEAQHPSLLNPIHRLDAFGDVVGLGDRVHGYLGHVDLTPQPFAPVDLHHLAGHGRR